MQIKSRSREREFCGSPEVLRAIERVFRPLARLLAEQGVTCRQAESLLRIASVHQAAAAEASSRRKPNASRIALATGLGRKEVARLLQGPPFAAFKAHPRPSDRVLKGWHSNPRFAHKQRPLALPIRSAHSAHPTFWSLSRRYAPDVYPGLVLRELSRVGAVQSLKDGRVSVRMRRAPKPLSSTDLNEIHAQLRDLLRSLTEPARTHLGRKGNRLAQPKVK
jgi:hypothetical protein